MKGNPSKEIMNQITHNEIFSDIWGKTGGFIYTTLQGFGDGVVGSVRNVADVAFADGKMNSHDYYLSYLQEFLSDGGFHNDILKLNYDLSSSVGNMVIPMALSAFVSPHAMSVWILSSTVGSEREKTLRSGQEENFNTWFNAVAKGIVAVGVEKTLGAFKGYGGKSDDLLKIFTSDKEYITKLMGTNLGKKLAYGISNSVNETIEELVENAGGYAIDLVSGRDIDLGGIPKETWETIYMTMLTTPLINMIGGSFQNSKHSFINRQEVHHFDGYDAKYSRAEIQKFTDNQGNVNKKAFFQYLMENGRINNIVKNQLITDINIDGGFVINTSNINQDSENDSNNYTVIRKDGNGFVTISKEYILELAKSGKIDEIYNKKELLKNHGLLYNNYLNTKVDGYYIEEIVRAIDGMWNTKNENLQNELNSSQYANNILRLRNSFDKIEMFRSQAIFLSHLSEKSDNDIVNYLNSPLPSNIKSQILDNIQTLDNKRIFNICSAAGIIQFPNISYMKNGQQYTISSEEIIRKINNDTNIDLNLINSYNEDIIENYSDLNLILERLVSENDDIKFVIDKENYNKIKVIEEYMELKNNGNYIVGDNINALDIYKWANTEMLEILRKNSKIDEKYIKDMIGKIHIKSDQYIIDHGLYPKKNNLKNIGGFFDQTSGEMYVRLDGIKGNVNDLMDVFIHEATHKCGNISDYQNRGFNETLTELFSKEITKREYDFQSWKCLYDPSVRRVQELIDLNIDGLKLEDFENAYYNTHSINGIRIKIDEIMGEGYFDNTLNPAVQTVLSGETIDTNKIDTAFIKLFATYQKQFK